MKKPCRQPSFRFAFCNWTASSAAALVALAAVAMFTSFRIEEIRTLLVG